MTDAHVEKAFEKWWPDLEKKLQNLPPDETTKSPHRDPRDLIAEVLEISRATTMDLAQVKALIVAQTDYLSKIPIATTIRGAPRGSYGTLSGLSGVGAPQRGGLAEAFQRAIRESQDTTDKKEPDKK